MSTTSTVIHIAIVVAVLAWVMVRRFSPRPVRGDRRRWRLPLVLCAIGVFDLAGLRHATPPVHLNGTDLSFLVLGALVSAVLGLLRGGSIRIFQENGQLMQRYAPLTAVLWLVTIGVRAGIDAMAPSFGVSKTVAGASLLLMFGISLLGEAVTVAARTAGPVHEIAG
jgi:hypothetical protein